MTPDSPRIFDLNKDLPPPADENEERMIRALDDLAIKVSKLLGEGSTLPEKDVHGLLELIPEVAGSARATAVLGFILIQLKEIPGVRDLYRRARQNHGPLAPFLYFEALCEERLGNHENALELLRAIIAQGVRNYWVFLHAAEVLYRLCRFSESAATANLAVYENHEDSLEPFVLLAKNLHALGEVNRMLECFRRAELMAGEKGLLAFGPLYQAHREMYQNIKQHLLKVT